MPRPSYSPLWPPAHNCDHSPTWSIAQARPGTGVSRRRARILAARERQPPSSRPNSPFPLAFPSTHSPPPAPTQLYSPRPLSPQMSMNLPECIPPQVSPANELHSPGFTPQQPNQRTPAHPPGFTTGPEASGRFARGSSYARQSRLSVRARQMHTSTRYFSPSRSGPHTVQYYSPPQYIGELADIYEDYRALFPSGTLPVADPQYQYDDDLLVAYNNCLAAFSPISGHLPASYRPPRQYQNPLNLFAGNSDDQYPHIHELPKIDDPPTWINSLLESSASASSPRSSISSQADGQEEQSSQSEQYPAPEYVCQEPTALAIEPNVEGPGYSYLSTRVLHSLTSSIPTALNKGESNALVTCKEQPLDEKTSSDLRDRDFNEQKKRKRRRKDHPGDIAKDAAGIIDDRPKETSQEAQEEIINLVTPVEENHARTPEKHLLQDNILKDVKDQAVRPLNQDPPTSDKIIPGSIERISVPSSPLQEQIPVRPSSPHIPENKEPVPEPDDEPPVMKPAARTTRQRLRKSRVSIADKVNIQGQEMKKATRRITRASLHASKNSESSRPLSPGEYGRENFKRSVRAEAIKKYGKREKDMIDHEHRHKALGSLEEAIQSELSIARRRGRITRTRNTEVPTSQQIRKWPKSLHEQYKSFARLGGGTYGTVFRAQDKETGETVAIKQLNNFSFLKGIPPWTFTEIAGMKVFDHPNVVKLRSVLQDDEPIENSGDQMPHPSAASNAVGIVFLVMDYQHFDLFNFYNLVPLNEKLIKGILLQILLGLKYIHSMGYLHRDLKPQNILLSKDCRVQIGDLGLAGKFTAEFQEHSSYVCSLWYRPPELLLGGTVYGPSLDVWGVGCILMELLIGRPAFQAKDEEETMKLICQMFGTPSEESWPDVNKFPMSYEFEIEYYPAEFQSWMQGAMAHRSFDVNDSALDLLSKMMALNPENRISIAEALNHEWFKSEPLGNAESAGQIDDVFIKEVEAEVDEQLKDGT